jgi:hypothetical protein
VAHRILFVDDEDTLRSGTHTLFKPFEVDHLVAMVGSLLAR